MAGFDSPTRGWVSHPADKQWPLALTLWVCHLVLLLPGLGLTEHPHYTSDRYSYMPSVLWSVLLTAGLSKLCRQPKARVCGVAALIVLVTILGAMSFRQTHIWRDSVTLFEYMLAKLGPDPYRAAIHLQMGKMYADQQKLDEAVRQYRLCLEITPAAPVHDLLAEALEAQGKLDEALGLCSELLRRKPDAWLHAKVGMLLAELGQIQEAILHYREALRFEPNMWQALNNLAWILATDAEAGNRNGTEAVKLAERACELAGQQEVVTVGTLAAAYAEAERFREAVETAQRALTLAEAANDRELANWNRKLLQLFQSRWPYRESPKQPASNDEKE